MPTQVFLEKFQGIAGRYATGQVQPFNPEIVSPFIGAPIHSPRVSAAIGRRCFKERSQDGDVALRPAAPKNPDIGAETHQQAAHDPQ